MRSGLLVSIIAFALTAATALPPLAAYGGKYPFDKIRGYSFISHPLVRKAVSRAVWSKPIYDQVMSAGVAGPISQSATLIVSSTCEPHNCGDHNWTLAILKPRGPAAVCYHDQELTDSNGRWFIGGTVKYVTPDGCTGEIGNVPSRVIADLVRAK